MTTKLSKSSSKVTKIGIKFKAINDMMIILEDPIDMIPDQESGLNSNVTAALKAGTLVLPEKYESFAEKFPCRGEVVSIGDKCKSEVKLGDRVIFARMGCQRLKVGEKIHVVIREMDVHAILC